MPQFQYQSMMPVSAETLYAYHAQPGAFERLKPPWQHLRLMFRQGRIDQGDKLGFMVGRWPFCFPWIACHENDGKGTHFADIQEKGPFKSWRHDHLMQKAGSNRSLLRDQIHYHLPWAPATQWLFGRWMKRSLERLFHYRHLRTFRDLVRQLQLKGWQGRQVMVLGGWHPMIDQVCSFISTAGVHVSYLHRKNGEFQLIPYLEEKICAPMEKAEVVIHTGLPYTSEETKGEEPFAYLAHYVHALKGRQSQPRTMIHLRGHPRSLDWYGSHLALGMSRRQNRESTRDRHLAEIRPFLSREIHLHLAELVRPSYRHMLDLLLRMESIVFSDRQQIRFHWIGEDDVVGAIAFLMANPDLSGTFGLAAPQPDSRETLQILLLRHGFTSYTAMRLFRVLPWSSAHKTDTLDPFFSQVALLTNHGFSCQDESLPEAFRNTFGLPEPKQG